MGDPVGQITEFTNGLTPNGSPSRIATGPDGNLWFTEIANPGRIGRITTGGDITEFTDNLTANSQPVGMRRAPTGTCGSPRSPTPDGSAASRRVV